MLRMNGDTVIVIVNGCYAPHYHKSYKENCNIHPVFGFYTQLSTEEWWRTVFNGSVAHLGIPDEDLELAFHNVFHNFDYQLLPLADKLLENLNKENTKIFAYTNSDERIHKALRDLDIDQFFDYVMTSAESGLEKPRLEGYIRLMQVAEIEDPKELGLNKLPPRLGPHPLMVKRVGVKYSTHERSVYSLAMISKMTFMLHDK